MEHLTNKSPLFTTALINQKDLELKIAEHLLVG